MGNLILIGHLLVYNLHYHKSFRSGLYSLDVMNNCILNWNQLIFRLCNMISLNKGQLKNPPPLPHMDLNGSLYTEQGICSWIQVKCDWYLAKLQQYTTFSSHMAKQHYLWCLFEVGHIVDFQNMGWNGLYYHGWKTGAAFPHSDHKRIMY